MPLPRGHGRTRYRAPWLALLLGLAIVPVPGSPAAAQARASLWGRVLDTHTRAPIRGAKVFVTGLPDTMVVDAAGRFVADSLVTGAHVIEVRAIGYGITRWTLELMAGRLEVAIELEARLPVLDTLRVVGRWDFNDPADWRSAAAFELRRQRGRGQFVAQEILERGNARTLGEVLRTVPGVLVACRGVVGRCEVRLASGPRGPCVPSYYLDGAPASLATGPDFPLVRIRGIEVYRALDVPPQFTVGADRCGVIAMWTRMER